MARYAKARSSLYTGSLARAISGDMTAWAVAPYLIFGPHSNMVGLYRLPLSYLCEDLGLPLEKGRETLARLFDKGFSTYDEGSKIVFVTEAARHEWGEHPNLADNNTKPLIKALPEILARAQQSVCFEAFGRRYGTSWAELFRLLPDPWPTLMEGFADPSATLAPSKALSKAKAKEEEERSPQAATRAPDRERERACQYLLDHWNREARPRMLYILGQEEKPRAVSMTDTVRAALVAALKAGYSPEEIKAAMDNAANDAWLMGVNGSSGAKTNLARVLLIRPGGSNPIDSVSMLLEKTRPDPGFDQGHNLRRTAWAKRGTSTEGG